MDSFGERIRHLRKSKKVYQKDLAKALEVAESTISMYERGEREPSIDITKKLADYFSVPLDYLLGRTNEYNEETNILEDELLEKFHQYIKSHPDAEDFLKSYIDAPEEQKKKVQKFWREFVYDQ